jgi:pimeloyl-ACP methyl ester carboxylesterase
LVRKEGIFDHDEIQFLEFGLSSNTLVLLHGFGGSHLDFEPLIQDLSKEYRVVIPRMASIYLPASGGIKFSEQVRDTARLIEFFSNQDMAPVKVAASSYGAALAWAVAIERPELIQSLCLISPMPPDPVRKMQDIWLQALINISVKPLWIYFFLLSPLGKMILKKVEQVFNLPWEKDHSSGSGSKEKNSRTYRLTKRKIKVITLALNRFALLATREDWGYWRSRLNQIKIPVQFIWGGRDRLFKRSTNLEFESQFSNHKSVEITDAGHIAMLDRPNKVKKIMQEFFSEASPAVFKEISKIVRFR